MNAGSPGADGDMNVFARTEFGACILNDENSLNLPDDTTIRGTETPSFFIGDDETTDETVFHKEMKTAYK